MKVDAVSSLTGSSVPKEQQFTDREKRDELAKEVNRRKVDYPGQVRQGRIRQEQADRSKAIMYAIWLDYVAKTTRSPTDHDAVIDDGATSERQPLNAMAHAGDGDGALREVAQPKVIGVDAGVGDDMTTHHVIAGGGDGEIGRPVRPTAESIPDPIVVDGTTASAPSADSSSE